MHILSPETDNCPSWISRRERMTVENISWSISMPTSNFQPIRLLDPDCCYKFVYLMANSADPDQLASSEANWSGSTLFAKAGYNPGSAGLGLRECKWKLVPYPLSLQLFGVIVFWLIWLVWSWTHWRLETPKLANSADPNQMAQNAASDQGLHCLQTVQAFFFRNTYII